jgi:hypothetical protein
MYIMQLQKKSVMLQFYLHDFYNIIFKTKHKSHIALRPAPFAPPPTEKFRVRTRPLSCPYHRSQLPSLCNLMLHDLCSLCRGELLYE